jgi:predicted TIM-barrel fold metal-dependent hydrolase
MFLAPGNTPAFAKIAERHPQLALVIDHMALSVDIAKAGKIAEALTETVTLAKYPNVSIKLSSSPLYSSEPYPFRDMNVHLKRCYDAFGPRSCHWGTDITNSPTRRPPPARRVFRAGFLSEDDKDWIMGERSSRSWGGRNAWAVGAIALLRLSQKASFRRCEPAST